MKTVMKFSSNLLVTVPIFREFYPWEVSVLKKNQRCLSCWMNFLVICRKQTSFSLFSSPSFPLIFSSPFIGTSAECSSMFVFIGYRCTCNCRDFPYCKWYQSPQRGSLPLVSKVNLGICILIKGLKWFW